MADARATVVAVEGMTIGEAAARTCVDVETLRYYERAGVLRRVARDDGGRRVFTEEDVDWIGFVRRLRATGMPISQVAAYTEMVRAGDGTCAERRALLAAHRDRVGARIAELAAALDVLDLKLAHYDAVERGDALPCHDPQDAVLDLERAPGP